MKTILIISPEPWDAHTVSKHHYALTLAKQDFVVYFLNPFDSTHKKPEIKKIQGKLYNVTSPKVASGLRYYPAFLRHWLEKRWLTKLEQQIGSFIDTIWLFENSRFFDLRFAGKRLKIYHQVDLNQDFNPSLAAKTADICFCTTDFIRHKLTPFNPKTYKIHHGYASSSENLQLPLQQTQPFENTTKIHVAYIGNLDICYLDIKIVTELVLKYSHIDFHFIGGYSKEGKFWEQLKDASNVCFWGHVHHTLIPIILKKIDMLLVSYLAESFREQLASPHKFMEYFASGKVIVATYTDEYKDKRHLLEMVDHNKDYINTFEEVINNFDYHNSSEKQQRRIAFAQAHTYEKQLDKIFALLKKHQLI